MTTDCATQEVNHLLGFIDRHPRLNARFATGIFVKAKEDFIRLAAPIIDSGVPYLPGIANAGDIMRGLDLGLTHFKFFPAEASGGLKALKALAAPFSQCRFCPTGGITEASAPEWLAFDPVLCVGGSWVTGGSMAEVEAKARKASGSR